MNRDLSLVASAMFMWGLGEGLFLYFQPIYLEQLGADPLAIGAILGGFGLAMTVAHIPAGYLSDRLGRRAMMVAAWGLGMLATWTMALAQSLPVFVLGLLLYGVTLFVLSPLNSYVTAARGRWSVGRAITMISAFYNLGAVLGPLIGGQVADRYGLRQNYTIAGLIFILSTLVILLIRPQPVERLSPEESGNGRLLQRRYLIYLAAIFVATFAMYLPQPLSPNFMQNQRGLSFGQIGQLYSLASIGVVVLNLTLGQLPARLGFLLGQVAVGAFALLLWQSASLSGYRLGFFLLGGYKTARSLGVAQIRELIPQSRMGLAFGLAETVGSTAIILTPPLAGYLYTQDPRWIYALSVALVLLSLLVSARFSPRAGLAPLAMETIGQDEEGLVPET